MAIMGTLKIVRSRPSAGEMKAFVFRKVVQALGLLLLAFLLLRIVGPWLVDLHNTAALVLAAILLTGGALLAGGFACDLIRSIQRTGRR